MPPCQLFFCRCFLTKKFYFKTLCKKGSDNTPLLIKRLFFNSEALFI